MNPEDKDRFIKAHNPEDVGMLYINEFCNNNNNNILIYNNNNNILIYINNNIEPEFF